MLSRRMLSDSEAAALHEELKTTPNILGYTRAELIRFRDVFVAEIEGKFAGACISKDLLFGWTDIAVLYVLPAFRGRGIARVLYTAAWQQAEERGRNIFTMSCSPEVIHLMEQFGMEIKKEIWKAPLAFHLYMNIHMSSFYRTKEAIRKARQMKKAVPFVIGTKRNDK